MLLFMGATLTGSEDISLFRNRLPLRTIQKAFSLALAALLLVAGGTCLLSYTENATFLQVLFETMSAYGTTGLSTGITPHLTTVGKWAIIVTMYFGRIGPLALGYLLIGRPRPVQYRYADADILVG
jgi:trk system potassium uptake protein TrkH